ncbi:aspartic peptidase domain-containing protein [Tirmania nivea]|nr:aspartic peptidase domain-containing protein [Tirmania nivea]
MITATPPALTQTLSDEPPSSTSTLGGGLVSPAPEPPTDGVYPIPLIVNKADEWGYPVVQVTIGVAKVPINLAVSIHSNETWLLHSSTGVCTHEKQCTVLEPDRLVQENGMEKKWNYTGQNGLMVSGNQYIFSSFEPLSEAGVGWRLENFTVGVAWMEGGVEGLGEVDGVLGLGPGSTFLKELTQSSQRALSIFMGKDSGTLIIGGYLPTQASGNFTNISTDGDGVVQFKLQSLTIKGDTANLLKDVRAIIDPGLPDMIIPKTVQESLATNENTKWTTIGDKLQFGSDGPKEGSRPSFVFDLGDGVHVEMSEESYTLAKEPAFRVGADDQIILGRSFLRSAYLVMDNTHRTYHLAQANVWNTNINNPTAITVLNNGQGEARPSNNTDIVTDPNTNINDNKASSSSEANDSASGKRNDTGIIIGGVVAGLVVLALIFGVILYRHRRSQRQINEIKGYMSPGKRSSEGFDSRAPPAAAHRSTSPSNFNQEDTHLMEGYPVQKQHPPGSRESIFREEMNMAGPMPLPPTMQYHYEYDDHLGGPTSSRSLRRDQNLVRTESIVSTTDVDVPAVERSAPSVPRLPMYCTKPEGTAL